MPFVVYSKKFLEHDTGPGHPECPERLKAILEYFEKHDVYSRHNIELASPLEAKDDELLAVHDRNYVEQLKLLSSEGISFFEEGHGHVDNPFRRNTFEVAKLACGAAYKAAQIALGGDFAFALTRPPGHHASRNKFSGFCYLNNIAFAIKKMQLEHGLKKAMVVDIDVHCGDGTLEIFYDDPSVYYLSLHQDPRTCFPFIHGFAEENSEHVENVPLQPGTGDKEFLSALKERLARTMASFRPNVVGVSAGFDTFHLDSTILPVGLAIKRSETYREIGRTIAQDAAKVKAPVFAVLEGGYYLPKLGENAWNFMQAFL